MAMIYALVASETASVLELFCLADEAEEALSEIEREEPSFAGVFEIRPLRPGCWREGDGCWWN